MPEQSGALRGECEAPVVHCGTVCSRYRGNFVI